jgi:GAF domain-containing protein
MSQGALGSVVIQPMGQLPPKLEKDEETSEVTIGEAPEEEGHAAVERLDQITDCKDTVEAARLALVLAEELIPCEGGAVLKALESGELEFVAATGPSGEGLVGHKLPSGSGFAGFCVALGASLNSQEPYRDARFHKDVDIVTGARTRSLVCVPIRIGRNTVGCFELINAKEGVFSRVMLADLELVVDALSIAWLRAQAS